jgi:hypothetical protein
MFINKLRGNLIGLYVLAAFAFGILMYVMSMDAPSTYTFMKCKTVSTSVERNRITKVDVSKLPDAITVDKTVYDNLTYVGTEPGAVISTDVYLSTNNDNIRVEYKDERVSRVVLNNEIFY